MNLGFDFDGAAVTKPPMPAPLSPALSTWAEAQLDDALGTNKTLLKAIKSDENRVLSVLHAIVTIARAKAEAMTAARAGQIPRPADNVFGWFGKRPALDAASLALTQVQIPDTDIAPLPNQLIS